MIHLAMDTSATVGSVAVARGGRILARAFLQGRRTHAAGIVPAVESTLEAAGVDRRELDGIVVGSGPGSFTGVRVAAATAKALVHVLRIPLWAVSSLEAAALTDLALPPGVGPWPVPDDLADVADAPAPETPRYVLFDARSHRVYAACYRLGPDGVETVVAPRATELAVVLDRELPAGVRFVGDGALRHRRELRSRGVGVLAPPAGMPTADGLLFVLAREPGRAPVDDPASWEPDYLRATGAERARASRGG